VPLELAALLRLQSMVGSLARKTLVLLQDLTATASQSYSLTNANKHDKTGRLRPVLFDFPY